jgi:hypothetical protein
MTGTANRRGLPRAAKVSGAPESLARQQKAAGEPGNRERGNDMMSWWVAQPLMKQFFLMVAVPSTVILLIQSVMTVAGIGDSHDTDMGDTGPDAPHGAGHDIGHEGDAGHVGHGFDGFRFFTVRGIIAFLSVFGWLGAAMTDALMPVAVFAIAFMGGLVAMTLIGLGFWAIVRLQARGNLDYRYSIGLQGEVYLAIPPARSGMGKVMVTLQERLVEVDAITDEKERLPTGSRIRVVGLDGNNVLLVSKEWEGQTHAV